MSAATRRVERWLTGRTREIPGSADLARYIQERDLEDYPATEREPAGTVPRIAWIRRAASALAAEVLS